MSEIKKIENAKVEVTCTVDGEKWKEANKKAFHKLSSNLEIKGFRKGQAPESVVKKHLSDAQVNAEALENVAQDLLIEAIKEHGLELIDRPELKPVKLDNDTCVVTFICPVYPDVELGDYKNLGYKVEEVNVSDEDVEKEVEKLKEQKADLELKEDGAVEDGDITVIDFEGFKDGKPFDGGKAENYELTIGSGSFIPGFEDQLIGMKSGEEKDINVSFPEDYHVDELKGQPVVFKVKLHEIKRKVLAVIDDELIKDLKIENVNTVDEFKSYVKKNLTDEKTRVAEQNATQAVVDKLIEESKIDIPEVMVENELNSMVNEYAQRFAQQGLQLEQFLKMTNQTMEDLRNTFKDDAVKRIKTTLCLNKISKVENLKVEKEDIDKSYEEMSTQYGMDVEEIKKYLSE